MLRFDLAEVIRTPGMRQVLEINEPPYEDDDVEYVSPVTGRVTATNTGTMLLVRGPVDTTIAERCSRCLTDVRIPIHAEMEEDFDLKVMEDPAHHVKSVQVVEEDEIGRVFDGKVLQLGRSDPPGGPAGRAVAAALPRGLSRHPGPAVARGRGRRVPELPFRDLSRYLNDQPKIPNQ